MKVLNKVKVITIVGIAIGLVRAVVPDFEIGAGFQTAVEALVNSLFVIIPVAIGWFTKETKETRDALVLK